jgi:Cdc6-like AAA superfamily ATPase
MSAGYNNPVNLEMDPAEQLLIKHSRFLEIYGELQECFEASGTTADPMNKAIVGPSGTGKSTVAAYFENQYPTEKHDEADVHKVLLVRVPTDVTRIGLAATFLKRLKEPYPARGSLHNLTDRVDEALSKGEGSHGIRLVILNEFQHFIDSKFGVPYETADWLKDRIEESGLPFVILGLDYGLELLDQNEQLFRLFPETIEINPFTWEDLNDRRDFRGVLREIRLNLADSYQFPDMERVELAFRLHYASFGLIGYLMKIIRGAARLAREAETKKVTQEMLAQAYSKLVRGKKLNPLRENAFNQKTAPQLVLPSETAAQKRLSWRERGSGSRMPIRRDRNARI